MSGVLHQVEQELKDSLKKDLPDFKVGDTVKLTYKIIEGDKERLHRIEGIVMKTENSMHKRTFTMRRISYGVGMEVTMPLYSPKIDNIEITVPAKRKPRRSKLYYLRGRVGKAASTV